MIISVLQMLTKDHTLLQAQQKQNNLNHLFLISDNGLEKVSRNCTFLLLLMIETELQRILNY